MTPPVEHDTIALFLDDLRGHAYLTRDDKTSRELYEFCARLERIDAEMRKELWVACAERQHQIERAERLDDELADLRAKLAACERREPPHCSTCDCGTPPSFGYRCRTFEEYDSAIKAFERGEWNGPPPMSPVKETAPSK